MNHQMLSGSLNCRVWTPVLLSWKSVFILHPFTNMYLYKSPKNRLGTQARRFLFPIYKETGGVGGKMTSLESHSSQRQSPGPSSTSRRLSGISQNYMDATPRSSQLLLFPPSGSYSHLASCPLGEDRVTQAMLLNIPDTSFCD